MTTEIPQPAAMEKTNDPTKESHQKSAVGARGKAQNIREFMLGILLCVDGVARLCRKKETILRIAKQSFYVACALGLVIIVVNGGLMPLRIVAHALGSATLNFIVATISTKAWILVTGIPEILLLILRHCYPKPMDEMFITSQNMYIDAIEAPQFKLRIKKVSQRTFKDHSSHSSLQSYLRNLHSFSIRLWNRVKFLLLIWLCSFLPQVGFLAWPLATFTYLGKKINYSFAVMVFIVSFFDSDSSKYLRGPLLRLLSEFRGLSRELVEPYLSRSKMSDQAKKDWLVLYDSRIMGFTFTLFAMLKVVPIFGPIFYFAIANSCAARLCLEILDEADFLDDSSKAQVDSSSSNGSGINILADSDDNSNILDLKLRLEFLNAEYSGIALAVVDFADVCLETIGEWGKSQVAKMVQQYPQFQPVLERFQAFKNQHTKVD